MKAKIITIVVLVLAAIGLSAILTYKAAPKVEDAMKGEVSTSTEEQITEPQTNMDKSTATAQDGDLVSVKYTGKLTNGTVFDASDKHGGNPIQFVLGASMVIKGWDEGIKGMKIGEKKTLTIAPEKAYGPAGVPDGAGGYLIPPNSTLVFDVELVDIQRK